MAAAFWAVHYNLSNRKQIFVTFILYGNSC